MCTKPASRAVGALYNLNSRKACTVTGGYNQIGLGKRLYP